MGYELETDPHLAPLSLALRRTGAMLLDMLVVYAWIIVLTLLSFAVNAIIPFHGALGTSYVARHLVGFFTLTLPIVMYFALMEGTPRQASWGKRRLGLRVVARRGGAASMGQRLLRNAVKFLPWEMVHTHMHLNPGFMMTGETSPAGWMLGIYVPCGLALLYVLQVFAAKNGRTIYETWSGTATIRT